MDRSKLFYRPQEGYCGDFIPFYWEGVYHLYHIEGYDWRHISTTDFVNFKEHGIAIESGGEGAQDRNIFTGCITEHDGVFHAFYCGHNVNCTPQEVILHATSKDLDTWVKDKAFCIKADGATCNPDNFRDALVFYNDEAGEHWMLITATTKEGYAKRCAVTAVFASKDYVNWEPRAPIYKPYMYDTHECPDIFKMGDTWYLVFSEYTRWWETKYRVSDSPSGPWEIPADDMLDGRTFYAAKTVSNGSRRFIVGWVCHKKDGNDKGKYQWGGNLLVHEVHQGKDGRLLVKPIQEVTDIFSKPVPVAPSDSFGGEWRQENGAFVGKGEGFTTLKLGVAGADTLYTATIKIAPGTYSAGVVFRADYSDFGKWCLLKIEPKKQRIYFDAFYKFFDDVYFDETRPITVTADGVYKVKIVTAGNVFSIYVNNEVAMSGRCHSYPSGDFGVFVENGNAEFCEVQALES